MNRTLSDPAAGLLARIREGDREACRQLFERLGPVALRVARRMVGDDHAAEDIVQDAFMTAFARAGTLQDDRAFRSWFFAIVTNRARDHYRARRRDEEAQETLAGRTERPPSDAANLLDRIRAGVRELPSIDQDLFQRVLLDRESYESAAGALGLTAETVRSRLFRLRLRLRDIREQHERESHGTL